MAHPASKGLFAGLGRLVTRHPVVVALGVVVVLGVLASPLRDLQTGWVGDDADPPEMTQKQAYDLLSHGLGPGVNGELIVVVKTGKVSSDDASDLLTGISGLQAALVATDGVKTVSPPLPDTTDSAPTAFVMEVQPTTGPDDAATSDLVKTLRADTIPAAVHGTSLAGKVHVGGLTATIIDLDQTISDALPLFMGVVLGGAFLLLLVVFRSVLIGLKAVVMNLLTIGATFGVLVAVFQWGWARGLIGMTMEVDIVSFVPLLVFAIVFGLSMDYEVFLMSGMQEAYARTGDPRAAVQRALGTTGRVIISAALVMFAVFVSFVSSPNPMVKQIGLGLAVGVLIDALLVRLLLVPSLMRLFGRAGWWLPHWLGRIIPDVSIEGGGPAEVDATATAEVDPGGAESASGVDDDVS
jgi:RND superfamily putative drug exporter